MTNQPANVFSIDVEDWFHILDSEAAPVRSDWAGLENRVERNTAVMLEMLENRGILATFFILGWIARQYPQLVRTIAEAGHEIASHGHEHGLVYQQQPEQFRQDLRSASDAIEEACGIRPQGYRAPGFSITEKTPWAFDILAEEGFRYDSSVFPAKRGHGGLPGSHPLPSVLPNGMTEFPITTCHLGIGRVAYLGGGYLRVLPQWLVMRLAQSQQAQGTPLILYIHPRDIDPDQPRIPLGKVRTFKSYVGLASCGQKLEALLDRFSWTTFKQCVSDMESSEKASGR